MNAWDAVGLLVLVLVVPVALLELAIGLRLLWLCFTEGRWRS